MTGVQLAKQTLRTKPVASSTAAALLLGVGCIAFAWTSSRPVDGSVLTAREMQSIWGDGCVECSYEGQCCIGRQLLAGTCYLCDNNSPYLWCCACCPQNVPAPCVYGNCGNACVGHDQYQHNICGLTLAPCDTCPFTAAEGALVGKCMKADYENVNGNVTACTK
jgi:hypothetical protein